MSTLCPLPWNHFSVGLDRRMRLCCNTNNGGYIKGADGRDVTLDDIGDDLLAYYNLPQMKEIRQQMMQGERPPICQKCFDTEDAGGVSLREVFAQEYLDHRWTSDILNTELDGTIAEANVAYFDVALGNKCNLKCMMCNPVASDQLKEDFDKLGIPYWREGYERASTWDMDKLAAAWTAMLPSLDKVLITGGEPLINWQHLELLDRAVETGHAQHIRLTYHSNLSTLPQRVLDRWRSFRQVDLHVSLEGRGALQEYIRYGSKWSVVEKNFERVLALRAEINLNVEVHTVLQASNVLGLTDLYEFLLQHDVPTISYPIWIHAPWHHSAVHLPTDLKLVMWDRFERFVKQNSDRLMASRWAAWNHEKIEMTRAHLRRVLDTPVEMPQADKWRLELGGFQALRGNSLSMIHEEYKRFGL